MKRALRNLGPGIVAGIIVACGGPITQSAALLMQDAGDALIEAGGHLAPDATRGRSGDSGTWHPTGLPGEPTAEGPGALSTTLPKS